MYKSLHKRGRGFFPSRNLWRFAMRVSFFYMVLLACSVQLLMASSGRSQGLDEITVTTEMKDESLDKLFKKIEKQTGLVFVYSRQVTEEYNVTLLKAKRSVKETLDLALVGTSLKYEEGNGNVLIYRKESMEERLEANKDSSSLETFKHEFVVITVSGMVSDTKGNPMAGVNILEKGTTNGTTTDAAGRYVIDVRDDAVLVFSFIGFKTLEEQVNGRTVLDIMLEEDVAALKEVVVNAGYWTVNKSEKTGNISKVKGEDIQNQPIANPLQALQGRITGLQISQVTGVPGGDYIVRVRGRNSISSGNDPLYIINGVPYTSSSPHSTQIGSPMSSVSPLNFINPKDIESIEVLKDADATAIYGSRGANGVILITTKGGKPGETKFDVNIYSGMGKVSNTLDLLNREQYLEMRNEAFANDEASPGPTDYDLNGTWDNSRETDWQDVLIGETAGITNIDATISGGNANTQFLLGAGYYKETTVFPGDFDYKKSSVNFNANHTSTNQKFESSFSVSYLVNTGNLPQTDLTNRALTLPSVAPKLFTEDGSLNWENSTWINPLLYTKETYEMQTDNLIGNVLLTYKLTNEIALKSNLGYTSLVFHETKLSPRSAFDPARNVTSGSSAFGLNSVKTWIIEPQAHFSKDIAKGKMNILIGTTFQEDQRESEVIRASGFSSDALLRNKLAASKIVVGDADNSIYRYNAIFGRINYNWKEKYVVNLTARRDGSSRFGPGKRFANFGAAGAAWIFSNEGFLDNSSIVSFGKLRISYGTTGNDQIGNYQFLDTYSPTGSYFGTSGLRSTRLFNPDFSWESTRKFEVGLEMGLYQERIFMTASFYRNRSSNQLLNFPLAPTTGFLGVTSNLPATVQNSGLELELNSTNVRNSDITWSTSLNISFPKNKLIRYPDLETSSFATIYKIGESLNIRYTFKFINIDSETGIVVFEDLNENGPDAGDQKFTKEVSQEFYGGLQNSVTYHGLRFDFHFQFVRQTGVAFGNINPPGTFENKPSWVLDRWQEPGDLARYSQFTQSFSNPAYLHAIVGALSDFNIVDASFIRLQNLSLSYNFQINRLRTLYLQSLRFYFQAQNLFTITNFHGLDPGNASSSDTRLPALRILTLGAQLTF